MIRKAIIVVLTLATVWSAGVWVASYARTLDWGEFDRFSAPSVEVIDGQWNVAMWPMGPVVTFPALVPFLLFAAYPFFSLGRAIGAFLRRRRRQQGLCIDCGYDLTGNKSGVCSECGTKAEQP